MNFFKTYQNLIQALFMGLVLLACSKVIEPEQRHAGPCTETGNPTGIHGKVLGLDGKPVSGARVQLFHKTGLDTLGMAMSISEAKSCQDGSFAFAKIAASTYSLWAHDSISSTLAWRPNILLPDTIQLVEINLSLSAPAQLSGQVNRGPNTLPPGILRNENILIRIINTDKYFQTDTSGRFHFPRLGAGIYRLAISSLDGHYRIRYVDSVVLNPGHIVTLPPIDLEWSPFVTPPAPKMPSLDSMEAGAIRFHWNPVRVSNLLRYEVERRDSLEKSFTDTLSLVDTVFFDSMLKFSPGHKIHYRVRTINTLGTPSEWSAALSMFSPIKKPSPERISLVAHVSLEGMAVPAKTITLYKIPSQPDAPDTIPNPVEKIASSKTDINGNATFAELPQGLYGIEAADDLINKSSYIIINTRKDNLTVQLSLLSPGSIRGTVSRQALWISESGKENHNIHVSLLGTPFKSFTGFSSTSGSYTINNIPPGQYDLALFAPPNGYFLVDTIKSITVKAGETTEIPLVKCRYNPSAPPPKPIGLKILTISNSNISLQWNGMPNYPFLKGYEVLRLDKDRKIAITSGLITATTWSDSLLDVPSGTQFYYTVRVISTLDQIGISGGDLSGNPIAYKVP